MRFFLSFKAVILGLVLLALTGFQNQAVADMAPKQVPDAKLVGEARFEIFFFKIYDAQLFAPDGVYDPRGVYALRLNYLVDAKEDRIIKQTVKEMKRMKAASHAKIESWVPLMEEAFIDMDEGSFADFIRMADGTLTLAANGKEISRIEDKRLVRALMNIWLGKKVRDEEFRDKLMGRAG